MNGLIAVPPQASLFNFMTNIEQVLINDEILVRLLTYYPEGYDRETKTRYLNPMSDKLPNLVDKDSDEYWDLVTDRIRKGEKRIKIEEDAKCYIYMHEGRDRSVWGSNCVIDQEVIFSIYIHEKFESDWRMSQIKDRISHLLVFEIGLAGYGKMQYVGGDPRDATTGYRRIDYRYMFKTAKKRLGYES